MDAGMRGLLAKTSEATVLEDVTRIARNHLERMRCCVLVWWLSDLLWRLIKCWSVEWSALTDEA